jgi:hypothetical protein
MGMGGEWGNGKGKRWRRGGEEKLGMENMGMLGKERWGNEVRYGEMEGRVWEKLYRTASVSIVAEPVGLPMGSHTN